MRSIEALKEKARHHEQNEQWMPARDLYMQAIEALDEEAHLDIGLYNRVGDILVKIGDYESAVEHYQQATDLYLEAELPNNAIAVCKKVARHLPGRNEIYLRMGQIRASQGFLVDARENFLIYAAKVEEAGDTEEAIRALVEFAALAPEDTEIRLAVAHQLEKHGREGEALEQVVAGYRVLQQRGDQEQAKVYAARIRELDPKADPDALADAMGSGDFESTSLGEDHGGGDAFEASFGDIELDPALTADPPTESGDTEGEPEISEAAGQDPGPPAIVEADFGEIVLAGGGDAEEEAPDKPAARQSDEGEADEDPLFDIGGSLPLMAFGEGDETEATEEVAEAGTAEGESTFDDIAASPSEKDPADGEWLVGLYEDEDADDDAEVPLPFLDFDDESEAATPDPVDELPGEAASEDEEVGPLAQPDSRPPVTDWSALRAGYDPDRPNSTKAESLVEAAFQNGEASVLIEAYELLARALEADGDSPRALDVWAQIQALDPDHPGAFQALGGKGGEDGTDADAPGDEVGYVDLGSLIFGEEEKPEKTTRFQVAYQEPTGDEAADFAKMLSQFKAKVAENFDAEDVRAHHDLGTAYKEMGLLDEAVAEFQQALRASANHLPTYELLGQTFMDRGEHAAAVRVLERALKVPSDVEDELIGIYYYLGRAHEELGQVDDAVGFYDRVFALDINFADVTSRLRELR